MKDLEIILDVGGAVHRTNFTLDRSLPGPEHQASSTPSELAGLVRVVQAVEIMQGSPEKHCQAE